MRQRTAFLVAVTIASALIGLAVGAYIVSQQTAFQAPAWLPLVGEDRYVVHAELETAQAVMPGQGQAVTIAGVRVGLITAVELRDGKAVATLELEPRHGPIRRDATLVLRPRTPLKDMFVALSPGTEDAPPLPDGGTLPVAQTQPDVNVDEILAGLDGDTRAYLALLLEGAGTALGERDGRPSSSQVSALRATLEQFEPLARNGRRLTEQLARRRAALRRTVRNLNLVAAEVGRVDDDLAGLVDASAAAFGAFAEQDGAVRAGLDALPGTLAQAERTLRQAGPLGSALEAASRGLRPAAAALAPGLRATRPVLSSTLPVVRDELRPFARDVRPLARTLRPAAADLATITPQLGRTVRVFQRLFDTAAYNPAGREEGYLFWGSWFAHIAASLTRDQDAHGPIVRALPLLSCAQLEAISQVEAGNEILRAAIRLMRLPDRFALCPGQTPPIAAPVTGGAR